MTKKFEELIKTLLNNVGLDDIEELTNPFSLVIDNLTVNIEEQEISEVSIIVIYSSLGIVPEDKELTAYRAFLEANLLWSGTGDATIGVNTDTREAMLCYQIFTKNIDAEVMADIIDQFVTVAIIWREFILALEEKEGEVLPPNDNLDKLGLIV